MAPHTDSPSPYTPREPRPPADNAYVTPDNLDDSSRILDDLRGNLGPRLGGRGGVKDYLPPRDPEYVVTLSYGLHFVYDLDGVKVRVGSGEGCVMDARGVVHGVDEVEGEEGRWRVGVVVWRGRGGNEHNPDERLEYEQDLGTAGLWGEEDD